MTIESTTTRKSYDGNDVSTMFVVPFKFLADEDLVVILHDTTTGEDDKQILDTDYTVTGAGSEDGGAVTFTTAPATGKKVVIYRDPSLTQGLDLEALGDLPAEEVEKAFDRLTMIAQRLDERVDRSLQQPDGDEEGLSMVLPPAEERASKYLGFDANGEPMAVDGAGDATPISDFMKTVVDDPDAQTARETLGAARESMVNALDVGAKGDGVTDDVAALNTGVATDRLLIPHGDFLVGGGQSILPDNGAYIRGLGRRSRLLAADAGFAKPVISLYQNRYVIIEGLFVDLVVSDSNPRRGIQVAEARLFAIRDNFLRTNTLGAYPIFLLDDIDRFLITGNIIETATQAILLKSESGNPGVIPVTDFAITNNVCYGPTADVNTATIGISVDIHAKRGVIANNVIRDFKDPIRGQGIALAGDALQNKTVERVAIALNSIYNIGAEGIHIENASHNNLVLGNMIENVTGEGIQVFNTSPCNKNTVAFNHIRNIQRSGISATGTGQQDDLDVVFNTIDGAGDDTDAALVVSGPNSNRNKVIGNKVVTASADAAAVQVDGQNGGVVAYNTFITSATGKVALKGRSTATNKRILIESNNILAGAAGPVDPAAIANFMGDQIKRSKEFTGGVADDDVLFVAQRPGIITALRAIKMAIGGTQSPKIDVGIAGGAEFSDGASVNTHTGSVYEVRDFALGTTLTARRFQAGNVITVKSLANANAGGAFIVEMEFFYYD